MGAATTQSGAGHWIGSVASDTPGGVGGLVQGLVMVVISQKCYSSQDALGGPSDPHVLHPHRDPLHSRESQL